MVVVNKARGMVVHPAQVIIAVLWLTPFCITVKICPVLMVLSARVLSIVWIRIPVVL